MLECVGMFKGKTVIMHKFVSLSRCALKVNKTQTNCLCVCTHIYTQKFTVKTKQVFVVARNQCFKIW